MFKKLAISLLVIGGFTLASAQGFSVGLGTDITTLDVAVNAQYAGYVDDTALASVGVTYAPIRGAVEANVGVHGHATDTVLFGIRMYTPVYEDGEFTAFSTVDGGLSLIWYLQPKTFVEIGGRSIGPNFDNKTFTAFLTLNYTF